MLPDVWTDVLPAGRLAAPLEAPRGARAVGQEGPRRQGQQGQQGQSRSFTLLELSRFLKIWNCESDPVCEMRNCDVFFWFLINFHSGAPDKLPKTDNESESRSFGIGINTALNHWCICSSKHLFFLYYNKVGAVEHLRDMGRAIDSWQELIFRADLRKGPSIYDVRKILGFFYPSPLVRIWDWSTVLNSRNLPYYIFFWANPLPPQCGRHIWMPPKESFLSVLDGNGAWNIASPLWGIIAHALLVRPLLRTLDSGGRADDIAAAAAAAALTEKFGQASTDRVT